MLVTDIRTLVVVRPGPRSGAEMAAVELVDGAAVQVRDGVIAWFGRASEAPADEERVSAGGGTVVPGLIDAHSHVPFVGNRRDEFVRRVAGESYLSIMESGGGIRVSTQAVRAASEEALVEENLPRLGRMLREGVTTLECKSGYGLRLEDELKQLRAARRLDAMQPIDLVGTYLGAHAVPAEFAGRGDAFVEEIAGDAALRAVVDEGLARFCDVFCDRGAFTVAQARRVLERGRAHGLQLKMHADELEQIGASKLAGEMGAVSADHLEVIDDAGIEALRAGGTVAVALPGTSFFLGIAHCDARKLIDAGLPVALATDCNPGSSHIESLPLVGQIACCELRMRPEEVVTACTANAAAALGMAGDRGAIATGYVGDLLVLDTPDLADWFYTPGRNRTRMVIKRGSIVYESDT